MLDGIYSARYRNWWLDSDSTPNFAYEFQLLRFNEDGKVVCRRTECYDPRHDSVETNEFDLVEAERWIDASNPNTITLEGTYSSDGGQIRFELEHVADHDHRVGRIDAKYWGANADESLFFSAGRYLGRRESNELVFVRLASIPRDWLVRATSLRDRSAAAAALVLWSTADDAAKHVWKTRNIREVKNGLSHLQSAGLIDFKWIDDREVAGHTIYDSCAVTFGGQTDDLPSEFRRSRISEAFALLDSGKHDSYKSITPQEVYEPGIGHLSGISLTRVVS